MCGIRLNEVIVQVDPCTDEEWQVRKGRGFDLLGSGGWIRTSDQTF